MPSVSQPFRLTVLPKIASLNNFATQTSYLQVADTLTPLTNKINIGISGSAVSQYIVNPTPKLVYNLPIPSTNTVSSCDVAELAAKTEGEDPQEVWCYALVANKVFSLNTLIKPSVATASTSNFGETFENNKVDIKYKAVNVKVYPERETIVAVLENGLIQTFDFQLKLLHSIDATYGEIFLVQHFTSESGLDFVCMLSELKDKKSCFKLFEVNELTAAIPVKELNSVIIEDCPLKDAKLFYQYGKIYRLCDAEIKVYNLPHFQLAQTINLPFISSNDVISFKAISTNRALLTAQNKIYLLDLLHNATLSERELSHVKTFQLLRTAVIPGNTSDNDKTFAIGVSTKHGANPVSTLDIINVDVGTGTLRDSMGKGFSPRGGKPHTLKSLLSTDNETETEEFDYSRIVEELEKVGSDSTRFDSVFFNKLNVKKDYYTDSDRFLNNEDFLEKVVGVIFDNFVSEYPRALTYLLTHPLFPLSHTKNLLKRFKEHPRLFKQAIVTCPNLPLDDLLHELFTVMNDELSLDLSLRILQDLNRDFIKSSIKKMSKVDTHNFINFVVDENADEERNRNKPRLFQLLSLVLDSVGLFALEDSTLIKLSSFIDDQVRVVQQNIELLNLLEDSTVACSSAGSQFNSSQTEEQVIKPYSVQYLDC